MSETDRPITQKQNSLIWEGLHAFRKLTQWTTTVLDPERICAAFFKALEVFFLLNAWAKREARERNDHIFVLKHLLPTHQILKVK